MPLRFREAAPDLAAAAAEAGWTLWSAARLSAAPTEAALAALAKVERDQIAYWRPQTIGQIVFNHWD